MNEAKLGILGGMGPPTRLMPCGDPGPFICSGQVNCPGIKVSPAGRNAWHAAPAAMVPMPVRREVYIYE